MTTFVTEDGETGQIYISGGVLPSHPINSSTGGSGGGSQVTVEDDEVHNIATITSFDGQVLSLETLDQLEQLAGKVF